MKLTETDKQKLREWRYADDEMGRIQEAITRCKFEDVSDNCYFPRKYLSLKQVLEILEHEVFLSGIARAAWHATAIRHGKGKAIYFNNFDMFS